MEKTIFRNKNRIYEKINELMLYTSAHGLPRMLRNKNFFIKIIWSMVLIASSLCGSYFVIKTIFDYLRYEPVTTISILNKPKLDFPTLSFCSTHNLSAPLNEIILGIRFNNKDEPSEFLNYFDQFNHSFYHNNCFRFNSGKNFPLLSISEPGSLYGFRFEMNLSLPDYIDYTEIAVSFHNKNSLGFELNDGDYFLPTGSLNYFEIEQVQYENLPQPYNDCLKDVNEFNFNKTIISYIHNKNKSYSQKDCFSLCSILFAIEKSSCGCRATYETFKTDCEPQWFESVAVNTTKRCIEDYLFEFRNKYRYEVCLHYCPLECDRLHYNVYFNPEILSVTNGVIHNATSTEPGIKQFKTYEEVKKNYICIYVYYRELVLTLIKQEPKTQLFECVSSIGGIFSLFLGISFLSFFEIFEIILEVVFIFISKNNVYPI